MFNLYESFLGGYGLEALMAMMGQAEKERKREVKKKALADAGFKKNEAGLWGNEKLQIPFLYDYIDFKETDNFQYAYAGFSRENKDLIDVFDIRGDLIVEDAEKVEFLGKGIFLADGQLFHKDWQIDNRKYRTTWNGNFKEKDYCVFKIETEKDKYSNKSVVVDVNGNEIFESESDISVYGNVVLAKIPGGYKKGYFSLLTKELLIEESYGSTHSNDDFLWVPGNDKPKCMYQIDLKEATVATLGKRVTDSEIEVMAKKELSYTLENDPDTVYVPHEEIAGFVKGYKYKSK